MATEKCFDCLPGILNKSKSTIAAPICEDCGDYEVDCGGVVTLTPCVISNITLPCVGLDAGVSQSVINLAFDTKLCQVSTGQCTASISNGDNCCGYLSDKIVAGDGIEIEVIDTDGCLTLSISETCYTWTPVTAKGTSPTGSFLKLWVNASSTGEDYQVAQYSNVKECTVRLRGTVINPSYHYLNDNVIFVLPSGLRPLHIRRFSVTVIKTSNATPFSGIIQINPDGSVILYSPYTSGESIIVSLDSIFFEID